MKTRVAILLILLAIAAILFYVAPVAAQGGWCPYKVKPGDSMSGIAARCHYGCWRGILAYNLWYGPPQQPQGFNAWGGLRARGWMWTPCDLRSSQQPSGECRTVYVNVPCHVGIGGDYAAVNEAWKIHASGWQGELVTASIAQEGNRIAGLLGNHGGWVQVWAPSFNIAVGLIACDPKRIYNAPPPTNP